MAVIILLFITYSLLTLQFVHPSVRPIPFLVIDRERPPMENVSDPRRTGVRGRSCIAIIECAHAQINEVTPQTRDLIFTNDYSPYSKTRNSYCIKLCGLINRKIIGLVCVRTSTRISIHMKYKYVVTGVHALLI